MERSWKRLLSLLLTLVFVLTMVPAQAFASVEEYDHDHEEQAVVNSDDCAHDWYTEVCEPSCDEDGYTYYECNECGECYEDDFVDALGHDYYESYIEDPTCEDEGYTEYECSRCGDWYDDNFVEPLGHELDEYGICTRCGDDSEHVCVYEEVEHYDATCSDPSYTYYECPVCGDGYDVYGDTYADCVYESWVENATCEQGGYTYWSCVNCGDWYVSDETDPLGHDYYEEYHEDATCEYWGYTCYVCSNCGDWYDEEDEEPVEHNWVLIETRDYPLEGYSCRVYECSECWETYEERDFIYDSENIYIILTWGPIPRDLDSHLILNTDEGSGEVNYYNMTVISTDGRLLADLDVDDTSGYGPEQVTIYAPVSGGTYRYYVHDYTNRNDEGSDEMANSGATVRVYRGTTLLQTYTVPSGIRGNIWEVFSFDAESEGFEVLEHAYTTTHTDATCEEWGYTEYYCANCGDQYYENDEEPLGHAYVLEETADPTESEWGYELYSCSRCGDEREEPLAPTGDGHYWVVSYHEPATCQERGYDVYECVDCGDWYEVYTEGYGDHDWWCYHSTDAACTEGGYANSYCNWCSEEKVETSPALGHAYERISRIGATCLSEGIDVYECSRCGDYYSIVTGAQLEHTYEESFRQEPTCCRDGFVVYTCTLCGGSYVENLGTDTEAHNYVLMFSRPATCTEWGEEQYKCTECHNVIATQPEPTGEHEYVVTHNMPATCNEAGCVNYQCVVCYNGYSEYTEPTGEHDYVLTRVLEPTCCDYGINEYTCTICRGITSEATAKIDHNYYEYSRWEPYGDEDGWVTYRCTMCWGNEYTEILPATGEKILDEEGHFFYLDSRYLPTCTGWGNENYRCRLCGEWRTVYLEPTGEHNFREHWYNLPTCTDWGGEVHDCADCMIDEMSYEGYEPTGEHEYYLSWVSMPTCGNWGYEEYRCRLCDERYRVYEGYEPTGEHRYTMNRKFADALTGGYTEYTCEVCWHTEYEYELPTGECRYSEWGTTYADDSHWGCVEYGCADTGLVLRVWLHPTEGIFAGHEGHAIVVDSTYESSCGGHPGINYHCLDCQVYWCWADTAAPDGHDWYVAESYEATCDSWGYDLMRCHNCYDWYYVDTEPVLGHDLYCYDGPAATCDDWGERIYECRRCDYVISNWDYPPTGEHSWYVYSRDASTCGDWGQIEYRCRNCGEYRYEDTPPAGEHDFYVSFRETATCGTWGYIGYECRNCGEWLDRYDQIPPTGEHNYVLDRVDEPTCGNGGLEHYYCMTCYNWHYVHLEEMPHSWRVPPECVWAEDYSSAEFRFVCENCGCEERVAAEVTEERTEPTGTEDGFSIYTATAVFDGTTWIETDRVVIPAVVHSWSEPVWDWDPLHFSVTATFTCEDCGEEQVLNGEIEMATTEATCIRNGEYKWTATVELDGEIYVTTDTQSIAMLGHNYVAGDYVEPTCEVGGYTPHTCTRCGDSYKYVTEDPLGHDYGEDGVCTRCGDDSNLPALPAVNGFRFYAGINMGVSDVVVELYPDSWDVDAFEFYFSADGGETWTDCVYRHESQYWSNIYLSDFDLETDVYDKVMIKTVDDSGEYRPGVYVGDCSVTASIQRLPAKNIQLVLKSLREEENEYDAHVVIPGLTGYMQYILFQSGTPSFDAVCSSRSWNQWTNSEYMFTDSDFWYRSDCSWMLLRSNQVLEVTDDFTASVSFTQYGDWAVIEPVEPEENGDFLENLRIEMRDDGAHFVFDPVSLEDYPIYAFDFYNDSTGEWRSMPWMHQGETDLWFEPDYYFEDGETVLHFSALRITAFGREGVEAQQYVTDCDIAVALDSTLNPTLEFYQDDAGDFYFRLSGMNHNYWPNLRGWQANGDWLDIWDTWVSDDGTTYTGRLPNATSLEELYAGAYLQVLHYVDANHPGDMTLGIDYFMQYIHAAEGGHIYGDPEWVWSEDGMSAEAVFTCLSNDGGVVTVPAEVTLEVWDAPGCTWEGFGRRIATVERNGRTYTNNYYGSIPAVGHDYVNSRCVYCGGLEPGGSLSAVNGFGFRSEWVEVVIEVDWYWDDYTDIIEFYFSADGGETWTDCVYRNTAWNCFTVWLSDFDLDSGVYNKIMIKTVDEDGLFDAGVFIGDCSLTVDITRKDPLDLQILERGEVSADSGWIQCYAVIQGIVSGTQYYVFQSGEPSFGGFRRGSGWGTSQGDVLVNTWYQYSPYAPYVLLKSDQNCTVTDDTTATVSYTQYGDWTVVEPIDPAVDSSFLENLHVEGYPGYAVVRFDATDPDSYCVYTFDFSPDGGQSWRSMPWVALDQTIMWLEPEQLLKEGETSVHLDTIRITAFGNTGAETVQYIGDCDITIVRNTELTPEVVFSSSVTGGCYVTIENLAFNNIYPNISIYDANGYFISSGGFSVYDNYDGTADYTAPIGVWVYDGNSYVFEPETDMSRLDDAYVEIVQWQNCTSDGVMSLFIEYFQTTLHPVDSDHVYSQYEEPEWVWSEDRTSAEAVFYCVADDDGQEIVPAEVVYDIWDQPGCTSQGYGWFCATAQFRGLSYSDYYEGHLPALGHDYVDGYCTRCGMVDYTDVDGIRIELTWSTTYDLDAHLWFNVEDVYGEVYWGNRTQYINGSLIALLDQDVTSGYGPENIILVAPIAEGSYSYYVTGYDLSNSGATVRIYQGDELLQTYTVPTDIQGYTWNVFTFTGDGDFEPVEHEYVSGYVDPSCEEGGYTYYYCTTCDDSYREYDGTEPLGHNYVEVGHVAATCTDWGYMVYECSRCWQAYGVEDEAPLGHTYEDGVCIRCDQADSSDSHSIRIELTWGATPSDLDSHLKISLSDGTSGEVYYATDWFYYNGVKLAELDYDDTSSYGPENITIYAPIVEGTYNYYVRDYSNRTDESSTALANSGATVRVYRGDELLATYNVPTDIRGYIWEVFSFNGETFEQLEHEYTIEYYEPTCEEGGYTYYYCPGCGDSYRIYDGTEPLGHDYISLGHADATCESWGYTHYECTRCGQWYGEEDEAPLGHDYVIVDEAEATCEYWGYAKYECTRCGAGYAEEKEPLGHTYEGGVCIRCDQADPSDSHSIRIELTWGATPSDLDSHLKIRLSDGTSGEVYYATDWFYYNGVKLAELDYDDTSSYGPENITIYAPIVEGTYNYYVRDFSNRTDESSTALANSGATVRVYRGDELLATYNVPTDIRGYIWEVFSFNGETFEQLEHEYTTEYYEATCEEGGYTYYYCSGCGDSYRIYDGTEPLGHDYISLGHADATCESWGYTHYECTRCGQWYGEEDEAPLGHDYVIVDEAEATCEYWGYAKYECTRCGAGYAEDREPLGHSYEDGFCIHCGVVEEIPAEVIRIVLTWGYNPYDLDSHLICDTTEGYDEVDYADKTFYGNNGQLIADLDYDDTSSYGPETVTIYTYKSEDVFRYYVLDFTNRTDESSTALANSGATVCVYRGDELLATYNVPTDIRGYIWEVFAIVDGEIVALEHEYTTTYVEATCEEGGYTYYYCSGCGDSYRIYDTEPLGHDYVEQSRTEPSCEEWGYVDYECSRCGRWNQEMGDEPLSHSWGEWACDEYEHCRTCDLCAHTEYAPHEMVEVSPAQPATCTEPGCSAVYACVCGLTYPASVTEPLGHSYSGGVCVRCGEAEPGYDDTAFALRVQAASGCYGSEVTVSILLANNPGIASIKVVVGYDAELLELKSAEFADTFRFGANALINPTNPVEFNWMNITGESDAEGVFGTLTFKVLTDSRVETPITVIFDPEDIFDGDMATVAMEAYDGVVALNYHNLVHYEAVPAGCETAGIAEYWQCTSCGKLFSDAYGTNEIAAADLTVPATGHSYGQWYEYTAPGCETDGESRCDCTNCGNYESAVIPAVGHSYGQWYEFLAPGCETEGEERRDCTGCDHYESNVIPAIGHQWGGWILTTAPGCETAGVETRTCIQDSAHTEIREVPATGHSYGQWYEYTAPGCETDGEDRRDCANCGHYEGIVVPATGHSYGQWYEFLAPGCETEGEERRDCTGCDHYESNVVPAIGHQWGEWVVITEPGCETNGLETRTCAHDSTHIENRGIAAIGHDFGWTDGICTRCGDTDPEFDPTVAIVTENVSGNVGQTVTVPVVFENSPGVSSVKLLIGFDADILEFVSGEFADGFSFAGEITVDGSTILLSLNPNNNYELWFEGTCTLAWLTFKIKDTAEAGETGLSISYEPEDIMNGSREKVRFAVRPGTIEIKTHIPGDINGDGSVNNRDAFLLFRYVTGFSVVVNEAALDVSGDGVVNNRDAFLLFRYVTGFDVEIH